MLSQSPINSLIGGLAPDKQLSSLVSKDLSKLGQYFQNISALLGPIHRLNPAILAGVMFTILDISRLRKYMFISKRKIANELSHLTSNERFPLHYPKYLDVYEATGNAFLLKESHIREIWAQTPEPLTHTCFMVPTEDLFGQLLRITSLESMLHTLILIFSSPAVSGDEWQHQQHTRSAVESKYGIWHQSTNYQYSKTTKVWMNYSIFPSVRPNPKSKKALLEAGEFSGFIQPGVFMVSITDLPVKDDRISTLLLSSFYRLAIVKSNPKSVFPYVTATKFHYFIGPKDKSKYFVRRVLPADHINTAGMYRLGRDLELPMEVLEKIAYEFNAENYTKNMLGTRATQKFLDEFDGNALLNILESIPNFTYKFSLDQRELIATQHNSVVVGRSGTGKTTCAVMRMIGIRLLEVANKNLRRGIHKIRYEDLCELSYVKMIFITASPLLARNVSRLYHRVINYLKSVLRDKEKKQGVEHIEDPPELTLGPKTTSNMDEFEIIDEDGTSTNQQTTNPEDAQEGINLVNDVMNGFDINILEEAEKEIDELVKDIDLENDESEVSNTFSKISFKDFPLFLTVKEFFYLMDSLMPESFFARNIDNLIRSGISKHTGKKGYFRQKQNQAQNRLMDSLLFRESPSTINEQRNDDYSSDEEDAPLDRSQKDAVKKQAQEAANEDPESVRNMLKVVADSPSSTNAGELITEVEFEDFRDTFWPWYMGKLKGKNYLMKSINPTMMWNQIRNINEIYTSQEEVPGVAEQAKNVALAYKQWKIQYGNYDLNDIYVHIARYYENDYVAKNLVDFLFLDEIQDIPKHLLSYLRSFASKFYYFSGDNAQNITKGVTFRFKDLANELTGRRGKVTEFHALAINYRSHQNILEVGNNLVFQLRLFFPEMIEFLPPEKSPQTGPRPMLVPLGRTEDQLFSYLTKYMGVTATTQAELGLRSEAKSELPEEFISSNDSENDMDEVVSVRPEEKRFFRFKSSQVFITRDYRSKNYLLEKYPSSIVFTILEAKGMEFDDVILFNYFTDSQNHAPFGAFKKCLTLDTKRVKTDQSEFTSGGIRYCSLTNPGTDLPFTEYMISVDQKEFARLKEENIKLGSTDAGDELKLLYVAVTRARNRILIYDDIKRQDPTKHNRRYFEDHWTELGLVNFTEDTEAAKQFLERGKVEKVKEKSKWFKEGKEFMSRGLFEFAETCFSAGDIPRAYIFARYCREVKNLKRDLYLLEAISGNTEKDEAFLSSQKKKVLSRIEETANKLEREGFMRQAAQCYSVAQNLEAALEVLKKLGDNQRAAEYLIELGRYDEAFNFYRTVKDHMGMINCISLTNSPLDVVSIITELKDVIPKSDLQKLCALAKENTRKALKALNDAILDEDLEPIQKLDFTGVSDTHVEVEVAPAARQKDPESSFVDVQSVHTDSQLKVVQAKQTDEMDEKEDLNTEGMEIIEDDGQGSGMIGSFESDEDEQNGQNGLEDFDVLDFEEIQDREHSKKEFDSASKGSFEILKSDMHEIERLSESFVRFSLENKQIRALSEDGDGVESVFSTLSTMTFDQYTFREMKLLSKVASLFLKYKSLEDLVKAQSGDKLKAVSDKVYEIGGVDLDEEDTYDLQRLLEESGAYTLRIMVDKKVKNIIVGLGTFLSHLYSLTQIAKNYVTGQDLLQLLSQSFSENRRLSVIGFLTVSQRFDIKMVRDLISNSYKICRPYLIQAVLLGYSKQIVSILPEKLASSILVPYGEIQTLIMTMKLEKNDFVDRDYIITELVTANGVSKLLAIYKYFNKKRPTVLAALLYFASNYLLRRNTYRVTGVLEVAENMKNYSKHLGMMIEVVALLADPKAEQVTKGLDILSKLNVSKLFKSNREETGFALGTILQLLRTENCIVSSKVRRLPSFKFCYDKFKLALLYLNNNFLYAPQYHRILRGILLSFRVSLLRPISTGVKPSIDDSPLRYWSSTYGAFVHRDSSLVAHFLELDNRNGLQQLQQRQQELKQHSNKDTKAKAVELKYRREHYIYYRKGDKTLKKLKPNAKEMLMLEQAKISDHKRNESKKKEAGVQAPVDPVPRQTSKQYQDLKLQVADPGLEYFAVSRDNIFALLHDLISKQIGTSQYNQTTVEDDGDEELEFQESTTSDLTVKGMERFTPSLFEEYLSVISERRHLLDEKQKLKDSIKYIKDNDFGNDAAIKKHSRQLKQTTKSIGLSTAIPRNIDDICSLLMTTSPTGQTSDFADLYSFARYYDYLEYKLKASVNPASMSTPHTILKLLMLLFPVCSLHSKLHLYTTYEKLALKKFPKLKDTLFNLADSEYSFATGNTEEFVLGKIGLLEEIEGLMESERSLEFFLPYILEDLVLAFGLGAPGQQLVVPLRLYKRRVLTTPILRDNLVEEKGVYRLVKNCYNEISAETLEIVQGIIKDYSSHPATSKCLKEFRKAVGATSKLNLLSEEDQEQDDDEYVGVNTLLVSKFKSEVDPKQTQINLDSYEKLNSKLTSEYNSFTGLTKKVANSLASVRKNKKDAPKGSRVIISRDPLLTLSHTAQDLVLGLKCNGQKARALLQLTTLLNPATKILNRLYHMGQQAKYHLEQEGNLAVAHQVKVHDLVDIVVRAVDLEEEVLETYISKWKTETNDLTKDLEPLAAKAESLEETLNQATQSSKYAARKENGEQQLNQAESELALRMQRIKSRIYMSYNKSKMIAKQIFMLRKKAGAN